MTKNISYGFKKTVNASVKDVEARVREALQAEGFGVLTEVDIAVAFKEKLDIEFRPYKILGACNPPLAYAALSEEEDIGLLLPCNVIVYEDDEAGRTIVSVLDPVKQLAVAGRDDLGELAGEVRARLRRVIDAL
jgi:uncharacterized protein (DUF302 family)